jgi:hypothetical protein
MRNEIRVMRNEEHEEQYNYLDCSIDHIVNNVIDDDDDDDDYDNDYDDDSHNNNDNDDNDTFILILAYISIFLIQRLPCHSA